ncbi:MAG: HD domain-containing phosphohydrolase [Bacillota bacterium]
MREWEEKRAEELSEYILVTHIISVLIFLMVIASFYNLKLGKDLPGVFTESILIALAFLCIIVYTIRKIIPKVTLLDQPKTDELLLLVIVFLLTLGFLWFSKNFFGAKVLIMVPAIIAATAFGRYGGIAAAVLSGVLLFLLDYRASRALPDEVFQTNLLVGSVAVLSAWVVGGLMEVEKKTQRELLKLADYDQLTGLYNHRFLQEKLARSVQEAAEKKIPLAAVLFDIDQFKYYNTVYGYQKGDEILTAIGKLLLEEVHEPDYAARYGSDEFMVVLPGLNKDEAGEAAAILKERMQARAVSCLDGGGVPPQPFSISTGVVGYPADGDAALALIRAAEDDLFRTKYSGGKTYLYRSVLSEISTLKIKDAFPTLQTLVALINAKDRYTFGHSERVLSYALALAEKMDLSGEEKDLLRYGAYLHDIGKIEVESPVLNKPSFLDKKEWELMKKHTVWGSELLQSLVAFREILPIIRSHHENYDGSGYPDHLKGEEIPLLARILRLADSFDAMTSNRPYRKALTFSEACEELKRYAGTLYDPELVPLFLEAVKEVYERERRAGADSRDLRLAGTELELSATV